MHANGRFRIQHPQSGLVGFAGEQTGAAWRNPPGPRFPRGRRALRVRAVTLLEVMLSLALTALIVGIISAAVHVHWTIFDGRRVEVEEVQVARAVLRTIATDLRDSLQSHPLDVSALASLTANAASLSGTSGTTGAGTGGTSSSGSSQSSGSSKSSGSQTGSSGGSSSGSQTGSSKSGGGSGSSSGSESGSSKSGGSSGSSSGSQSGSSKTGSSGSSGTSPSGGSTSGSTSSKTSGTGTSGTGASTAGTSGMGAAAAGASSGSTGASTTTAPSKPGLYGTQFELQVDVSRLPRVDQYDPTLAASYGSGSSNDLSGNSGAVDIPSDVKTVHYYLQTGDVSGSGGTGAGGSGGASSGPGLYRTERDRAVASWASQGGGSAESGGQLLAPEVNRLEFRYFDGTDWLTEWNSDDCGGLPLAIEITLGLDPSVGTTGQAQAADTPQSTNVVDPDEFTYRMVVRLPAAEPASQSQTQTPVDAAGQGALGL